MFVALMSLTSIPAEAQIARLVDHISYHQHMRQRHREFKKHKKDALKTQRKLQSSKARKTKRVRK